MSFSKYFVTLALVAVAASEETNAGIQARIHQYPVGTIRNGTCAPTFYHGGDCDTHASGWFPGVKSLEECLAKVKPCKMGNYLSYGADKSCSWYQECDFAHLCVDCSKDHGPNCPSSHGLAPCPHYIAFTSEVVKIAPPGPAPAPPSPSPSPPGPMPSGCYVDNATGPVSYKFAPGNVFPTDGDHPHGLRLTDSPAKCCALCQKYKNCSFWTWEHGGSAAKPTCYQYQNACCYLKTAAAATGRTPSSQPGCTSGSTSPLKPPPNCRNGTECGGTNEWMAWHDTTLPNSTCTPVWCNPGKMPYPPSKDLVGWEYKSGCNPGYGSGNVKAASADTFFPTWAADGNLYTGFTDGHVHDDVTHTDTGASSEGRPPLYRVTHGQAVIVGDDPFELNFTKVKSFSDQSAWPYGGRFPSGSLVYKGTWWYGTYYVPNYPKGPLVGGLLGPLVDFRHSLDMGETWIEPRRNATGPSDNLFGEVGDPIHNPGGPARVKFGTPHWVDFGQELEHSPDGKAYLVAHGATSPDSTEMWMLGDQVYLARVTPTVEDIDDRAKWEFYAGGHGPKAKWVAGDVTKAQPLVEFTNHTGCTTMTYFAGIKKYIMSINTASHYPTMDGGNFDTWFLEADDITGPWSLVTFMKNFGPQVYFSNFPSKFSAKKADTKAKTFDAFLMYSANYDPGHGGPNPPNSAYHMNLQQARFMLSDNFAAQIEQSQG